MPVNVEVAGAAVSSAEATGSPWPCGMAETGLRAVHCRVMFAATAVRGSGTHCDVTEHHAVGATWLLQDTPI